MSREWYDITRAVGRYEVQGSLDGSIRHRPKFYVVGQEPSARTWRPGNAPRESHPAPRRPSAVSHAMLRIEDGT
jgi:hypothetical protein